MENIIAPTLQDPATIEPFDEKKRPNVGQPKFMKELGWNDPVIQKGRWRLYYYPVREWDPYYYDPPVKDSVIGFGSTEMARTSERAYRDMPSSVSHAEWRDRQYFLDPTIKAIYEKYPIAKQHPGLLFRPTGVDVQMQDKNDIGDMIGSLGFLRSWPGIMPQTWKFFGAPFGEECHVKTAVCAKYGLYWGTSKFIVDTASLYIGRGWRYWLAQWYKTNSYTVPVAAAWGAATCISCSLRGKDDAKNMWAGGAAVGSMIGLRRGFAIGWYASIVATVGSVVWYYLIAHEDGLGITKSVPQMYQYNLAAWDPYSIKWSNFESSLYDERPWNF